jgi:LytS/YehU family sensor histidine kinase
MVPIVVMPLESPAHAGKGLYPTLVFTALVTISCYAAAYGLYPWLLLKKKWLTALSLTLLICLVISLASGYVTHFFIPSSATVIWAYIIIKFFIGVFVMAAGIAYRFILDAIRQDQQQREGMAMELSFLRSQVSPHFMFNTLNSMVALARKKSDKLEPALLELSNLMHYMLYESDQEKVSLSKEIAYIQSYIDLQTLRFGYHVKIVFTVNQPLPADPCIEPMLLIPLIENAFKHGIGLIEDPEITILLQVEKETLILSVTNKYNDSSLQTKDKTSGIGLVNLERRLKLLYPHKHDLHISRNGSFFKASLKLQLHDQVPGR